MKDLLQQQVGVTGMGILIPCRLEVGDGGQVMGLKRIEEVGNVVLMARWTIVANLPHRSRPDMMLITR